MDSANQIHTMIQELAASIPPMDACDMPDVIIKKMLTEEVENGAAPIREEYWWIDGDLTYANGDIGDSNHEGIAMEHACYLLANTFGVDWESESGSYEELMEQIEAQINEEYPEAWGESHDLVSAICRCFPDDHEINSDVVRTAFNMNDPRKTAVLCWGWIRLKGPYLDIKDGTPETLKKAYEAATTALYEEGHEDYEEHEHEWYVHLNVVAAGKDYSPTLASLRRGRLKDEGEDPEYDAIQKAADARLREIEQGQMHLAYGGHEGD